MNDRQILTLAISILVPLGLLFLGNSRITDVKEALRSEIRASESKLELRVGQLEAKMDLGFERMDRKLETILKILADHEARLPH